MKQKILGFLKNNREVSVGALFLMIIGNMVYDCETFAQRYEEPKPRPRFEAVYIEKHPEQGTYVDAIEVWHDKETGQEIVCIEGYRKASCYLTGRVWK
jgi:hypothetical protein